MENNMKKISYIKKVLHKKKYQNIIKKFLEFFHFLIKVLTNKHKLQTRAFI